MAQLVDDAQLAQWFPETLPATREMHRDAAEAYIIRRCRVPEGPAPADLVEACRLLVARYLARESSPDGTLGMSEFGAGRIATIDRDIEGLIAPYRPVVFG